MEVQRPDNILTRTKHIEFSSQTGFRVVDNKATFVFVDVQLDVCCRDELMIHRQAKRRAKISSVISRTLADSRPRWLWFWPWRQSPPVLGFGDPDGHVGVVAFVARRPLPKSTGGSWTTAGAKMSGPFKASCFFREFVCVCAGLEPEGVGRRALERN